MSGGAKLMISGILGALGAGVGGLFGNPKIGAQIGFIGGGLIGGALFEDEEKVTAKRLNIEKINIQSATYGVDLPEVYGNSRLKGNIIWWSGEYKSKLSDDKDEFEYSASFALAISEGQIGGIRRLWADNKLLFDQGIMASLSSQIVGDGYAEKVTFYNGSQTEPDPFIEEIEGVGNVPIYKEISYIVFQDFYIGPYGNRIPNIEVEVAESAEIIDDLNFPDDGNLKATSIEVLNGDLYVSYSENEYKSDSNLYATPKIKKMIGLSNDVDFEIEIDVETIKSFKFIGNGLQFVTIPIDFILDVGSTGTENDITNYKGSVYTYSGLFIQHLNISNRETSARTWFTGLPYERTVTELNGFVANDIDIISDEQYQQNGWFDAILRETNIDTRALTGEENIVITGDKWFFDTNNEWPEQPVNDEWRLIGKEHLYSAPWMYLYSAQGEYLGDQPLTDVINELNPNPQTGVISGSTVINNLIHRGYTDAISDFNRYASGGRESNHFFGELIDLSGQDLPPEFILSETNNNAVDVVSTFYMTRKEALNKNRESIPMWLLKAIEGDGLNATTRYILTYYKKSASRHDMLNNPGGILYWDVTDVFTGGEYIVDMTKYIFEDRLVVLFISNLGNVKIIREGSFESRWEDNATGGGQTLITYGESFEVVNFERFVANNVSIASIIEDLYSKLGITEYDNTEIANIEIGGYIRDTNTTAKDMIVPLMQAFYFDIIEVDWTLKAVLKKDTVDVVLDERYISVYESDSSNDFKENLFNKNKLPNIAKVSYIDIDRDYKKNTRNANWIDSNNEEEVLLKLPFIISSVQAGQIAEKTLQYLWNTRSTFDFSTTIRYMYLVPNDVVTVYGKTIRITEVGYDIPNRLRISGVEIRAGIFKNEKESLPNPGKQEDPANTLSDVSTIIVHSHSLRKENDAGYYVAMFSNKTWRGAGVYIGDTGQNMNLVSTNDTEADIGVLLESLDVATYNQMWDFGTTIKVQFQKNTKWIRTVTELEALAYENMIVIGSGAKWEIITYKTAYYDDISDTWELTDIIRGVNGSDILSLSHGVGSWVIPVRSLTHVPLAVSKYEDYVYMRILPPGFGTTNTFSEKVIALGEILKPWGVSGVIAGRNGITQDWEIQWSYRTRINGEWQDYNDIVNVDNDTIFIVRFFNPTNNQIFYEYKVEDVTNFIYTAEAQQRDWSSVRNDIYFNITQINEYDTIISENYNFSI